MSARTGIELADTLGAASDASAIGPGTMAGDYEVVKFVGAGAMGDVYEGRHPVLGKRVAIKIIKHVLAKDEKTAQRFIREARAVNQVDHPSVVDIFAFGRLDDGRLFLVMDFLEGETLGDYLKRRGRLDLDDYRRIMDPVCAAVGAAHAAGVIHRDLKPDNVFLATEGSGEQRVYVLDFGVAKLVDRAQDAAGKTLTGQGVWIGTPAYMAPEQWTAEGASLRSDIYALGAMSFELLSGKSPFSADSIPGVMEKHFRGKLPDLGDVPLPRSLEQALHRALAKDPADRFESVADLWQAIEGEEVKKAARPRSLLPIAVGVGMVAVVTGGLVVLASERDPRPSGEASEEEQPVDELGSKVLEVESRPRGAAVYRAGKMIGTTPLRIERSDDEAWALELRKPGFVSQSVSARPGVVATIELIPVRGFEGVWQLPEGALRRFERDAAKNRVNAYKVSSATDSGAFYRFFDFVPASDPAHTAYAASAEVVDEGHADEPSCRFTLRSEYEYVPASDTLTVRNEDISFDWVRDACVERGRQWGERESLTRVDMATDVETNRLTSLARGGAQFKDERPAKNPKRKTKARPKPKSRAKQSLSPPQKIDSFGGSVNAKQNALPDPLQQKSVDQAPNRPVDADPKQQTLE